MASVNSVTFLHVTDIHDSFDNLKSLELQLRTDDEKIDYILVSGDISTMPMETDPTDSELLAKFAESVVRILTELSKICHKIIYIPGNHDPIKFFTHSECPVITDTIVNVHKDVFRISEGLVVAGFGGSLPGYRSGEQVWDGYPHHDTESFEAEIEPFLSHILSDKTKSILHDDVILLMTHVGPDGFPTSADFTQPTKPITCGCAALRNCLLTQGQDKVFLNIHGHTHEGAGHNKVGKITISNPGPLQTGRYAIYTLCRLGGKWNLTSIHFKSLT